MNKKFIYTLLFTAVLPGGSLLPIAAVGASSGGGDDGNFGTPVRQLRQEIAKVPDTAQLAERARTKFAGGLFSPDSQAYYTDLEVAALRGKRDEEKLDLMKKLREASLDEELAGATRDRAVQYEQALEDIRRRLEGSRKQQAEIEAQMARLDEQVALKTREAQEAVAREEQLKQEILKAVGAEKQLKEQALAEAGAERELKEAALTKIAEEIQRRKNAMVHATQTVEEMGQTQKRLVKKVEELTQDNHSLKLKHGQVTEGHKALEAQNRELLQQFQSASAKKAQRGASSAVASDDDDDDGLAGIPAANFGGK